MTWRTALRSIRGTPVSTAMAVLSLALGIGACTALYAVLDSLLLRTLPVRDPSSLVQSSHGRGNTSWTNVLWEQIRDRPALAAGALAWSGDRFNLAASGQTDLVEGAYVSGGAFEVLGVAAVLGRTFSQADDARGGGPDGPVAVISEGFWRRRYGGAQDVVGRTVTLETVPFTIVGVTPAAFHGLEVGRTFDVAIPIGAEPLLRGPASALDHRSYWWLNVFFRLRPQQSREQAERGLRGVQAQIREATIPGDWPPALLKDYLREPFELIPAASGKASIRKIYQRPLVTLMVAVLLLLLIACVNIANLMLARASGRRHELAVRAAMGAGRLSLAWPLLAESLLIAGAGALLGLAFAQWASRVLVATLSSGANRIFVDLSPHTGVLLFTLAATTLATVVSGTVPAFSAARARPSDALAERGRSQAGGGRGRLSGALVAVQVALSLVLAVAAGLFGRTFATLATQDLGFDRDPVLVARVNTTRIEAQGEAQRSLLEGASPDAVGRAQRLLLERVREAARQVPGVNEAAISAVTPAGGSTWQFGLEVEGEPPLPENEPSVYVNVVTPGWFSTYGTRILAGRDVLASDVVSSTPVALVNQAFVRRYLAGKNPIGRQLRRRQTAKPTPPVTIVGVVEDAVYVSPRQAPPPTAYLAFAQQERAFPQAQLSVRSAGPPPATLVKPVAKAIAQVDPNLTFTFRLLAEQVNASLVQERLVAMLSGFFGILAVLLASVGLYGVTSYAVTRRRGEIGIRLALGGVPRDIVRLVLRRVLLTVGIGVLAGGIASYWAARFVKTLLYGLEPRDPATFAGAVAVLAAVGLLAGWLPARRAARIEPVKVLRES